MLKRILRVGIIFLLLLVITGFFLPEKLSLSQSKLIQAPAQTVFLQVSDLKNWKHWSPWHRLDTTLFTNPANYSTVTKGKGAKFCWNSSHKKVGKGCITITKLFPVQYMEALLQFEDYTPATLKWRFQAVDSSTTKLTWEMDMHFGYNPLSRYFGLFFYQTINRDFEEGLNNLNNIVKK